MTRLLVVALAAVSVGWLDPWGKAREAVRLYAAGKYDDAVGRYDEALNDQPDSPLLHFNRGDAAYRQGKYTDAVNAFGQIPTSDADPARAARVAYNTGNAKFRLGQAAEASDPKSALGLYAEALADYRRALGAAPDDVDAKFNHEFVEKKLADLKKKLEEQQKEQEKQPPQDQNQEQQQQQQKPQDQSGDQPGQQQQGSGPGAPHGPGGNAEQQDGDMSRQEAAALLDSQRDQELRPDEMAKRLQGAVLAEPA